jgi:hypothetical protein
MFDEFIGRRVVRVSIGFQIENLTSSISDIRKGFQTRAADLKPLSMNCAATASRPWTLFE